MGHVAEVQQAKKWIYDKLSANSDIATAVGTNILTRVPNPRPARYIIYNLMAGSDIKGVGKNRQATSALFQVRQVNVGDPDTTARLVDKRLDDVLQITADDLSGDYYFSADREQPIDRPEYDAAGVLYSNVGGLYRVWIRKAA